MALRRWRDYPTGYFNQAGSGPASPIARRVVRAWDNRLASLGAHSSAGLTLLAEALADFRERARVALGAPAGWQVAFCGSATDALNLVASSVPLRRGRLAAADTEHPSGLLCLAVQQRAGFSFETLPVDAADWPGVLASARRPSDLVVVSAVSYRTGCWQLPAIGPSAERDGLLVVDVSQAAGQVPLGPVWECADVVVGLGHKWLHGPLPTGFLCLRPAALARLAPPRGGWHARTTSRLFEAEWKPGPERLEPSAPDLARAAGLVAALELLPAGLEAAARARVRTYRVQVERAVLASGHPPLAGSVDGMLLVPLQRSARQVAARARERGVTVKDLNPPETDDLLRISLVPLHRQEEVDLLCGVLGEVLRA